MSRRAPSRRAAPWLLWAALLSSGAGCAGPSFAPLEQVESCDACQAEAAPPAGGRWSDGRALCGACRETAVVELGAAEDALEDARGGLAALELRVTPPLRLVLHDRPDLLEAAADLAHPRLRAFCQIREVFRGEVLVERTYTLHALRALPRPLLVGVLAHELFHVWQAEAGAPAEMAPAWREGAANWAQWSLHRARDEALWAGRIERDQDPTYGRGFRRFRALVDRIGPAAALERARRQRDF